MLKNAPIRAYIPASNITRARKFYEEVIGLEPKEEYPGGVIYGSARVRRGVHKHSGTVAFAKPARLFGRSTT
jgi:hypothetical protein